MQWYAYFEEEPHLLGMDEQQTVTFHLTVTRKRNKLLIWVQNVPCDGSRTVVDINHWVPSTDSRPICVARARGRPISRRWPSFRSPTPHPPPHQRAFNIQLTSSGFPDDCCGFVANGLTSFKLMLKSYAFVSVFAATFLFLFSRCSLFASYSTYISIVFFSLTQLHVGQLVDVFMGFTIDV